LLPPLSDSVLLKDRIVHRLYIVNTGDQDFGQQVCSIWLASVNHDKNCASCFAEPELS
jgi:hypothetical protein